jgi:hypothetical protein
VYLPASETENQFFEPTLSDVQAHHASVVARSKRLNEAPLLTAKYRDAEKVDREKRKADKWPEVSGLGDVLASAMLRLVDDNQDQVLRWYPSPIKVCFF